MVTNIEIRCTENPSSYLSSVVNFKQGVGFKPCLNSTLLDSFIQTFDDGSRSLLHHEILDSIHLARRGGNVVQSS